MQNQIYVLGLFSYMNNFKYYLIEYKCLCCNKSYQQKFDENVQMNMYKCSNHDSNKFIILLQKDVHPFEYMDGWEKFNEASLPEKRFLRSLKYGRY